MPAPTTSGSNINQIDPELARQLFPAAGGGWDAAALRQTVVNPFFGVAGAGELGGRATVPLGQLLRPFPQFGDVNVFERTEGGKRQFHAMTLVLDKRLSRAWWGGRYSYTWSRLEDNQFGEDTRIKGTHTVQIRFEILNLTNTAKFNGSSAGNSVDLASCGRITSQRGFMRIWQVSFRYAF